MKLLALILAFAISHFIPKPQKFRNFSWFEIWATWFRKRTNWSSHELTVIVLIGLPVALVSLVVLNVFSSILGGLLATVLILSYCIGPESLEEDVEGGHIREKIGIRKNAKVSLLIKKLTQVSLKRWFAVFFWYIVLGIVGVLLYRLAERLDFFIKEDDKLHNTITKLMKILNYPVAWMMVISLAIASDFERIFNKCKRYMNIDNLKTMDDSFLYEAADFAVENCEIEADSETSIEQVTINVLKRMLVVWLVFVSILVILAV